MTDTMSDWDQSSVTGEETEARTTRVEVVLDDLHDGRCKSSTWRGNRPARPTYENHFGPGGFNRCVGVEGHANPTHKDEWGHVFVCKDGGQVRVIRTETRTMS